MNKQQPIAPGTKINRQSLNRLIGAGGGDNPLRFKEHTVTANNIYAVVMSAIQCPDDPTARPDATDNASQDDADFYEKMGLIKIEGKTYKTKDSNGNDIDPVYDKCACRELAGKDDEYPEQLVKGTQIKVIKAGQYDNPDYNPNDTSAGAEPEKLDWYIAVETEGVYEGNLQTDIIGSDGTSMITIKDSDNTDVQLTVYGTALRSDQKLNAESGVIVSRINDNLVIVKAPCPEIITE